MTLKAKQKLGNGVGKIQATYFHSQQNLGSSKYPSEVYTGGYFLV